MGSRINIYIKDENIDLWKRIDEGERSKFISWCLENHLKDFFQRYDVKNFDIKEVE